MSHTMTKRKENAPACIAQQTLWSGCPGIQAMWPLFCPQALSTLSAPGCRLDTQGTRAPWLTPKGLWSIPAIPTQSGLCIKFSRDIVPNLKAAWKYFVSGDYNTAVTVRPQTSDSSNCKLHLSRASFRKTKLEHTDDRRLQTGVVVSQNFTNLQGGRLHVAVLPL